VAPTKSMIKIPLLLGILAIIMKKKKENVKNAVAYKDSNNCDNVTYHQSMNIFRKMFSELSDLIAIGEYKCHRKGNMEELYRIKKKNININSK
jgi:hypothetical protein